MSEDKRVERAARKVLGDYLCTNHSAWLPDAVAKFALRERKRALREAAGIAANYIYSQAIPFGVQEHPIPKRITEEILALSKLSHPKAKKGRSK